MTNNKNNKAQCKKYFLFFKMIISICVNRKLPRMKSTTKGENNRIFKRTVFQYVQALAPGSATTARKIARQIDCATQRHAKK